MTRFSKEILEYLGIDLPSEVSRRKFLKILGGGVVITVSANDLLALQEAPARRRFGRDLPDTFPPITDRKLIIMCAVGKRSAAAQKQLADSGIANLYNLTGGIDAWKKAGFETQGGKFEALDFSI